MYTVYESPRRSPRHVRPSIETSNILKPKTSPKRKARSSQSLKNLPSSTNALATTTRATQKKVRKAKINDENKENCTVGSRPAKLGGLGVNGSTLTGKMPRPTTLKPNDMRLPLKELPLNGNFDGIGKMDAAGVEVVVRSFICIIDNSEYTGISTTRPEERPEELTVSR